MVVHLTPTMVGEPRVAVRREIETNLQEEEESVREARSN